MFERKTRLRQSSPDLRLFAFLTEVRVGSALANEQIPPLVAGDEVVLIASEETIVVFSANEARGGKRGKRVLTGVAVQFRKLPLAQGQVATLRILLGAGRETPANQQLQGNRSAYDG